MKLFFWGELKVTSRVVRQQLVRQMLSGWFDNRQIWPLKIEYNTRLPTPQPHFPQFPSFQIPPQYLHPNFLLLTNYLQPFIYITVPQYDLPMKSQDEIQQPIANQQKVAIRTHYAINDIFEAERAIPLKLRQKIARQVDQIVLPHNSTTIPVTLKRKTILKPLHLLKIRRRINKRTQEISHIIEKCSIIKTSYEHQDLCDFISSQGANILSGSDQFQIDKSQLLNLIKDEFQERIQKRGRNQQPQMREDLWTLIKPSSFLKSYNLVPPRFFVNKVKHSDQKQMGSNSIGFNDPLPQPIGPAPQNIRQTQIFKAVSNFMKKRSCWLKNVLLYTLKQEGLWGSFGFNQLKTVLRYLCYTFRNGPWKHTFCAFDFDPRTNHKAVIYQSVSLKLKKKQAQDYQIQIEQQIYDPSFTDISAKYIRGYQLGDVALQGVQQLLRGKLISGGVECTKQHGWLSASEHSNIMKLMRQYRQTQEGQSQ